MPENPPTPTAAEIEELKRIFFSVWRTLAPERQPGAYYESIRAFQESYLQSQKRTFHGTKPIGPTEAAALPDNSADYETVTYRYAGLETVKAAVAAKLPVFLIGWHHGAIHHLDYAVARALPEIAIFVRYTLQYGRVFSIPMEGASALTLLRMDRFLRDGRPILTYIDGPPEGATVEVPLLGVPARFAVGPIRLARAIAGSCIVPVTHFLRPGRVVEVAFHPPVPPERLPAMAESDIVAAVLATLEADLRRDAPEQVLLQFIQRREAVARKAEARRAVKPGPATT
jgi:lauroyl/myristoyl acyltransferase